jgi:hypothetical protein
MLPASLTWILQASVRKTHRLWPEHLVQSWNKLWLTLEQAEPGQWQRVAHLAYASGGALRQVPLG